jgi:hypothetical protein
MMFIAQDWLVSFVILYNLLLSKDAPLARTRIRRLIQISGLLRTIEGFVDSGIWNKGVCTRQSLAFNVLFLAKT